MWLTKKFFSQHAQLLLVESAPGKGGELPAEHLRELTPGGPWGVTEETQVLRSRGPEKGETQLATALASVC